jgi:superfamily II DNA or RNA helicase
METKTWAHQDQALQAIANTNERSHVIEIPCGCGKTLIMEKQINAEIPKNKYSYNVILTPSVLLIKQTIKAFQKDKYNWVSIYYGKKEGKDYGFNTTDPNYVANYLKLKIQREMDFNEVKIYENLECEIDVETENIEDRYIMNLDPKIPENNKFEENKQTVIICSYASINVLEFLIENTNFEINALICDEGHHTISNTIQWIYNCEKIDKITHYTATRIEKMTNQIQGPTIYEYKIRDAIKDGIIHDYEIAILLYKTEVYHPDQNNPQRNKAISIEIDKLLTTKKNKHILGFNAFSTSKKKTSTNTKEFTELYKEVIPNVNIFSIDSNVKAIERTKIIEDFTKDPEHKYNILFNCKMMGEGINIPKVDTVVIIESSTSKCLTTQRLGRALRKNGNDSKSPLFVICVDVSEDEKNLIDLKRFTDVISCLTDLSTMDTNISKFINGESVETVKFYNQEYLTNTTIRDLKGILNLLKGKYNKRTKKSADDRFDDYVEFYNKHGRIPREDKPINDDEKSLAFWISRIRKDPNKLTEEQKLELNNIPTFYWNLEQKWMVKFTNLEDYIRMYGRYPPSTELNKDGKIVANKLHTFISVSKREKTKLTKDQIKMLESLKGWKWSVIDAFYDSYFELLKFYVKNKKQPNKNLDEEKALANWKKKLPDKISVTSLEPDQLENRKFYKKIYDEISGTRDINAMTKIINKLKKYAIENCSPFINVLAEDENEDEEIKTPNPKSNIKIKAGIQLPSIFSKFDSKTKGINRTNEQAKFRADCLNRFGNTCVLSGIKCLEVLDAAHIIPAEHKTYQNVNTENALLLEKTLHYAFDNFLFSINPKKMEIRISKTMQEDEVLYKRLKKLTVNFEFTDLEKDHLQWHYERFKIIDSIKLKNKESEVDKKQE